MLNAVCFRCGEGKERPLDTCPHCNVTPEKERHQIRSFCLSSECLKQKNLELCAEHIKKKKRCPKFHTKVISKAQKLLNQMLLAVTNSQSLEFSSSVFDFTDLEEPAVPQTMVLTHCVGKRKDCEDAPQVGQGRTYHQVWWQVGKDISRKDYLEFRDNTNELYVIYRWMEGIWRSRCVTKKEFDRFKMLETA